jgi:hypothetical protein
VSYKYFKGIYYERDYKRNITIRITILFVHGEREKKKQAFRECVVNEKRNFYLKKCGFVREDYSINSKRLFFSVYDYAFLQLS